MMQLTDELARRQSYQLRLYDVQGVPVTLRPEEMIQLALHATEVFTLPNRVAWVTDSELCFGLLRIYSAYREEHDQLVSRVFKQLEPARLWLQREKSTLGVAVLS